MRCIVPGSESFQEAVVRSSQRVLQRQAEVRGERPRHSTTLAEFHALFEDADGSRGPEVVPTLWMVNVADTVTTLFMFRRTGTAITEVVRSHFYTRTVGPLRNDFRSAGCDSKCRWVENSVPASNALESR